MTPALDQLFSDKLPNGVYRMDMSLRPSAICREINSHGWRCCYLDGSQIVDKESLLAESAKVMSFPDYFGHNWDAFEECITDLTWIEEPGCVLLFDHAALLVAQHRDVWTTFYDIMNSAAAHWSKKSRPFYVLVRNPGLIPQSVPEL